MLSITAALVITAVLGLCFTSTRKLGILAVAILCFLFPYFLLPLALMGAGIYFFITQRRS